MTHRNTSWIRVFIAAIALLASFMIQSTVSAAPRNRTAPTKPTNLRVTGKTAWSVSLAWNPSTDNFGNFSYRIVASNGLNATVPQTATTYTFTVQARDNGINWSPLSSPIILTTDPIDPNDTTLPTMPGNLRTNGMEFGDEIWLFWDQSTDNVTPPEFIRYDVYLNGVLDHSTIREDTVFYVTNGVLNTIEIVAVDAAGNESVPATIMIDLRGS